MHAQASSLTEQEMENIAAFFQSLATPQTESGALAMNAIHALTILTLGLSLIGSAVLADDEHTASSMAMPPPTLTWAAQTFKNTCSACHGADGAHPMPLPGNPPPIIAG